MNDGQHPACHEPVAVIGAACRLPGGIDGLDVLWDALSEGRDLITDVPPDRFDKAWFHSPDPRRPGKSYTFAGGFLDRIEDWDPAFFGISPREAARIDPKQRMALEMAVEAFDDAGVDPAELRGSVTAVHIGVYAQSYGALQSRDVASIDAPTAMGNTGTVVANRISYHFDLRGPSLTVDTACSSSLVAVHQACETLQDTRCRLALAGGVNAVLDPYEYVVASKAQMLSPTGRSRAFSADADGFVRAEGGGLVVLKRLRDAVADGDRVHAVILGTGTNCDGHTPGLAHPSVDAQRDLLREVYARAGVAPDDLAYLEAHGTGTRVGDLVECTAIGQALGTRRCQGGPLPIGSVKTNVGHLEAAAGIVGLLKAITVIRNRQVPPSLHAHTLNPDIDFAGLGIEPVRALRPVRAPGRGLVGVNSFGAGGANAHVILGPPAPEETTKPPTVDAGRRLPVVVSGHTEAAVRQAAGSFAERFSAAAPDEFYALASTACTRRGHRTYRAAVLASDAAEAADRLAEVARPAGGTDAVRTAAENGKVAFVFSGNGAQWAGMGADLLGVLPAFSEEVARVDVAVRSLAGWSVIDELRTSAKSSRLDRTEYAQPALFAVQAGLVAELAERGVRPAAVAGHSVGEAAAFYACGVLTLESAARVVVERSRAQAGTAGSGRMAAVGLSPARVEKKLAAFRGRLEIAGINDERNVTVSGESAALRELGQRLALEDVFFRELDLDHPFHSRGMDSVVEPLRHALAGLVAHAPRIPMISTVTGGLLEPGDGGADYWCRNVREPVLFAQAVRALADDGTDVFVEIAPHPVLRGYLKRSASAGHRRAAVVPTLARPVGGEGGAAQLDDATCAVLAAGAEVSWQTFFPVRGRVAELPRTPWQRARHWNGAAEWWAPLTGSGHGRYEHPLLGVRAPLQQPGWHGEVEPARLPWLADHRLGDEVVMPGAAFAEMAAAAGRRALGGPAEVCDLRLRRLLTLPWDDPAMDVRTQVSVHDGGLVRIAARAGGAPWKTHAQAFVRPLGDGPPPAGGDFGDVVGSPHARRWSAAEHYARMAALGIGYGPAFRPLRVLHTLEDRAVADYELADDCAEQDAEEGFLVHPALLDAALQATAVLLADTDTDPFLPHSIGSLRRWRRPAGAGHIHVRLREVTADEATFDLTVTDDDGTVAVEIEGYRGRRWHSAAHRPRDYTTVLRSASRPGARPRSTAPSPATLASAATTEDAGAAAAATAEATVEFTAHHGARVLSELAPDGAPFDVPGLIGAGVLPQYDRLVALLASTAEDHGLLENVSPAGQPPRWRPLAGIDPDSSLAATSRHLPGIAPVRVLYERCARHLRQVLTGEIDAVQAVFPEGAIHQAQYCYESTPMARAATRRAATAVAALADSWPPDRPLRVLEVGGGTGSITSALLPLLPADRTEYVFTDVSTHLLQAARKRFEDYDFVQYKPFDLELSLAEQDLTGRQFDLVVAADVLHVASDLRQALRRVAATLVPDGQLLVVEHHDPRILALVFGLLEGFWSYRDTDLRTQSPLLDAPGWRRVLGECGFGALAPVGPSPDSGGQSVLLAQRADDQAPGPAPEQEPVPLGGRWVVAAEDAARPLADALRSRLEEAGGQATRMPTHADQAEWATLLDTARPDHVVLVLRHPREATGGEEMAVALTRIAVLRAFLDGGDTAGVTPHLWIVNTSTGAMPTLGARPAPVDAATWGVARVLDGERPHLTARHIALRTSGDADTDARILVRELACPDDEDEIVLTEHGRFVSRLRQDTTRPSDAPDGAHALLVEDAGPGHRLSWEEVEVKPPGAGEVVVEVRAASVTPRDAARATEVATGARRRVGSALAGVVVEVGPDVAGLAPGERVYGLAPGACASRVRARVDMLAPVPDGLAFTEAAALPAAFLTAHRALDHIARLHRGETLFIRGTGGGLALAATVHARRSGARVLAAAEQEADRDMLRAVGAADVFDSTDPALHRHLRDRTGPGPDVVLDCDGTDTADTVAILPPGGRLIRVVHGTQDAETPQLRHSETLFASVDAAWAVTTQPESVAPLFATVATRVADGTYGPVPFTCHVATQAAEAFQWLRTGAAIGETVLDFSALPPVRRTHRPLVLDPEGCYLITGGLGGFGAATAEWLAARGARRLVLVSRRGPATEGADALLARLREHGARATAHAVDVTDPQQVRALLDELAEHEGPLRGVVHSAVVLHDAAFTDGDAQQDRAVLAPKLGGTRVLDIATRTLGLDFFIVYSSITSAIGHLHQATYAAGNAMAEAVVRERRAAGLPGLAVQWSGIEGVGALADQAIARNAVNRGLGLISTEQAFAALEELLDRDADVAAVLNIDWGRLADVRPYFRDRPRLRHLVPLGEHVDYAVLETQRRRLAQAPLQEAREVAEDMLCRLVGRILGSPAGGIDRSLSLDQLGVDSIMAAELIGAIRKEFGCELALVEVSSGPSVTELAARVVARLREEAK